MLRLALLIRCGVTYRSSRFANSHSFLTYFRELWCYLQLASWLGCSSTTTPARLATASIFAQIYQNPCRRLAQALV